MTDYRKIDPSLPDVPQIAADLTHQSVRVLFGGGSFGRSPFGAGSMRPLVRRGLFRRVERKGFQTRWEITETGVAVRDYLKKNNHD